MKNKPKVNQTHGDTTILTASAGRPSYYFLNLAMLIAVPYLVTKFNENPLVIGVLIGILILVILPINMIEYFFVYEDRLFVLYKRVFFLQFLNRKRVFIYNEIEEVKATLKVDKKTEITAFMITLTSKFSAMASNEIVIDMKNGEKKYVNTEVYKNELLPMLNFMQKQGVNVEISYPNQKDI